MRWIRWSGLWAGAALIAAAAVSLSAAAQSPVGDIKRDQLQRQQSQDELTLKMKQSQEANRPTVTPDQRKDLEQQHVDQLENQRQLQDSQSRRQQQLEQSIQGQPASRQTELLDLQQLLFGREKIQEPQRDETRPGPPEVVK
jgi:TolA-binding protein